jgi:hypothetical protein
LGWPEAAALGANGCRKAIIDQSATPITAAEILSDYGASSDSEKSFKPAGYASLGVIGTDWVI